MHLFRPLFVFSFALIALFALAGLTSAGVTATYTVTITAVTCEDVTFDYVLNSESSNGADFSEYEIAVDGSLADSGMDSPWDGTITAGLSLVPRAAPYLIEVSVSIPGYATGSDAVQVVCGEEPSEPSGIVTGLVCFGRGAVAATVFKTGDSIDIYAIDSLDNGELVMSFTQEYLRTLPVEDEARLLGDSDRHIPIEFYRNANRLYRMVAGPDAEGKFFECTFGGVCSHERTWIGEANRPTDEVVPVCDPVIVPTAFATVTPQPTLTPTTTPMPVR
jgi:acyl carrier protein